MSGRPPRRDGVGALPDLNAGYRRAYRTCVNDDGRALGVLRRS